MTQINNSTVYLVDDDAAVRKAMKRLFHSIGMRLEAFESARAFLDFPDKSGVGCLILDVQMPGLTGLELQEELTARQIDLPIVFMTAHGDIPMSVKAMKAGAADFLPKPVDESRLLATVQEAIERHRCMRAEAVALSEFRQRVESLSKREHQVMTLVIQGLLNKQIADRLGITEYTVKVHRGRVMKKTGVNSLAELVRLYERAGLEAIDS